MKFFIILPTIGFISGLFLVLLGLAGLIFNPDPEFSTNDAIICMIKGVFFMGVNGFLGKIIYENEFN